MTVSYDRTVQAEMLDMAVKISRLEAVNAEMVEVLTRIVAIRDWDHDYHKDARSEYDNAAEQAAHVIAKATQP